MCSYETCNVKTRESEREWDVQDEKERLLLQIRFKELFIAEFICEEEKNPNSLPELAGRKMAHLWIEIDVVCSQSEPVLFLKYGSVLLNPVIAHSFI